MKTANIIIDKGLETEVILPVDRAYEDFKHNTLHANCFFELGVDEIPSEEIEKMSGRDTVTTVHVEDGDTDIPVIGTYRFVQGFQANYDAGENKYVYNLDLLEDEVTE